MGIQFYNMMTHNSQRVGMTQMSIRRWINKRNGILMHASAWLSREDTAQ